MRTFSMTTSFLFHIFPSSFFTTFTIFQPLLSPPPPCHPREGGVPFTDSLWIPAFAGNNKKSHNNISYFYEFCLYKKLQRDFPEFGKKYYLSYFYRLVFKTY